MLKNKNCKCLLYLYICGFDKYEKGICLTESLDRIRFCSAMVSGWDFKGQYGITRICNSKVLRWVSKA